MVIIKISDLIQYNIIIIIMYNCTNIYYMLTKDSANNWCISSKVFDFFTFIIL